MFDTLTPHALRIEVKLQDREKTETVFSFAEYLALMSSLGCALPTYEWTESAQWLLRPDNVQGRISIWSHVVKFRKREPSDPAVRYLQEWAIANEIPI
jgi:hypothetical protein